MTKKSHEATHVGGRETTRRCANFHIQYRTRISNPRDLPESSSETPAPSSGFWDGSQKASVVTHVINFGKFNNTCIFYWPSHPVTHPLKSTSSSLLDFTCPEPKLPAASLPDVCTSVNVYTRNSQRGGTPSPDSSHCLAGRKCQRCTAKSHIAHNGNDLHGTHYHK